MAESIIRDLFGDMVRMVSELRSYQGLTTAAKNDIHLKDEQGTYIKRKLRELDIANSWCRLASKGKTLAFACEGRRVLERNRSTPKVARSAVDGKPKKELRKKDDEKYSDYNAKVNIQDKELNSGSSDTSDTVIQDAEFNLGTSDTIDNIETGKTSDSDNSESSTVQQFYIGEGSDVGSQTVPSLPSEAHEVVMCATPEQVVTAAFNQLARDVGASFPSLALAISEVNSYEEYTRLVLPPISDVHAGTSDDAHVEGSIRDNELAVAVQDCWDTRVLVHKLDDAIYDEVENATTIDPDPAVVCELWSALAPRYKAKYYDGGSFLSWDIAAYLDAPWGGAIWGREVSHASDCYNITAMLDRLHIVTR